MDRRLKLEGVDCLQQSVQRRLRGCLFSHVDHVDKRIYRTSAKATYRGAWLCLSGRIGKASQEESTGWTKVWRQEKAWVLKRNVAYSAL